MYTVRPFNLAALPKPPFGLDSSLVEIQKRGPLVVEIGCGVGLHPLHLAQSDSHQQIIAIEQTSEKFKKFMRRVQNHPPLNNLYPVQADAVQWISHYIPEESLNRCYLLYPNPYPKSSQTNLRWAKRPFMGFLKQRLKSGGRLIFRSNLEDYALETKDWMTEHWGMALVEEFKVIDSKSPWTHFEKKYLRDGQSCYHLAFEKP